MTLLKVRTRAPAASRRTGYAVAVLVNAGLLWLVNVRPGWDAVPFLTPDTVHVLDLVNASIIAGLAANAAYLVADPRWLKSLGDLVTTAIGLAALIQIWRTYPFAFAAGSFDWDPVVRIVLVAAIIGSGIGIVAALASLLARAGHRR